MSQYAQEKVAVAKLPAGCGGKFLNWCDCYIPVSVSLDCNHPHPQTLLTLTVGPPGLLLMNYCTYHVYFALYCPNPPTADESKDTLLKNQRPRIKAINYKQKDCVPLITIVEVPVYYDWAQQKCDNIFIPKASILKFKKVLSWGVTVNFWPFSRSTSKKKSIAYCTVYRP